MNRRKKKKRAKKLELFAISFANSYREVKETDRSYHEFVLMSERRQRYMKQHNNTRPADTFEF